MCINCQSWVSFYVSPNKNIFSTNRNNNKKETRRQIVIIVHSIEGVGHVIKTGFNACPLSTPFLWQSTWTQTSCTSTTRRAWRPSCSPQLSCCLGNGWTSTRLDWLFFKTELESRMSGSSRSSSCSRPWRRPSWPKPHAVLWSAFLETTRQFCAVPSMLERHSAEHWTTIGTSDELLGDATAEDERGWWDVLYITRKTNCQSSQLHNVPAQLLRPSSNQRRTHCSSAWCFCLFIFWRPMNSRCSCPRRP